jgi:hypothetical protein
MTSSGRRRAINTPSPELGRALALDASREPYGRRSLPMHALFAHENGARSRFVILKSLDRRSASSHMCEDSSRH